MLEFARDSGRILLAASDPAELAFATNALTQAGYEVILAHSGEEALQLFRAQRPVLGIVEVNLKGLAVTELLPRVKAEPVLADVPVMLLAGAAGVCRKNKGGLGCQRRGRRRRFASVGWGSGRARDCASDGS